MRHSTYIKLTTPRKIGVTDDTESPTVDAPALKILTYSCVDEIHPTPHIQFSFGYGFINSSGNFVLLGNKVYIETVIDIPESVDEKDRSEGVAINPITKQKERTGSWLSDITIPPENQKGRHTGDFRVGDLYYILLLKYQISGTIVELDTE